MEKFAFYYEVEHYIDDGTAKEGGFLMAHDHKDAMEQLIAFYEPGLISTYIEYMNVELFVFPIEQARIAKDWVNENGSY